MWEGCKIISLQNINHLTFMCFVLFCSLKLSITAAKCCFNNPLSPQFEIALPSPSKQTARDTVHDKSQRRPRPLFSKVCPKRVGMGRYATKCYKYIARNAFRLSCKQKSEQNHPWRLGRCIIVASKLKKKMTNTNLPTSAFGWTKDAFVSKALRWQMDTRLQEKLEGSRRRRM